jgi:D-sedoheptulose 7-phosphate isomerase
LQNFYRKGDVVIGISGSGNSENVVRAMQWAKEHGAVTIAFTGYDGGRLKQIADYGVHIPVDDMQITEDLHMILDHCMMHILSKE